MAYTINNYNTSVLTVVEDGTVDQSTDLKLVGRNYAGYGEIQNENFVFLLENFAGSNQPPRALTGQIWYDSSAGKIKYWDGSQWRNTGGTTASPTAPAGLSVGDLWWDTDDLQLYGWSGTEWILVGPQDAGQGLTQMQSRLIRDIEGVLHSAIVAIVNDTILYIFSNDDVYTIDQTAENNAIPNFDVVRPGVTQINSQSSTNGNTTSAHRFFGTAEDSDRLDGFPAANYVREVNGETTQLTQPLALENDSGFFVGQGRDLKLSVENGNTAVIANVQGNKIVHRIQSTDVFEVEATAILPSSGSTTIGTSSNQWSAMYATNFNGIATSANNLIVSGFSNPAVGRTTAEGESVAVRDSGGNITANLFVGTATRARYADLAEIYTTDNEYTVGTVMTICTDPDHEACEFKEDSIAVIGVISDSPAYLMNAEASGQPIALKGRVPVRVIGPVQKGEKVFASATGIATTEDNIHCLGIALETNINNEEKLVECFLMV